MRALLVALLLIPKATWAAGEHADLMLIPSRVIIGEQDRYATVMVKNSGNATGNFSVELIDMMMREDGNIIPVEAGMIADYSAIPLVHAAPRSITLKPNEAQPIRLIVRKPASLENGEYRAHLKVRIVDENVDATALSVVSADQVSIAPKANLVIIIPVILRHGNTSAAMQIDTPKLIYDELGNPALELYLLREGNRSSMGDISVNYISPDGKTQSLAVHPGIPVYRPTPRRLVTVPLEVPNTVSLTSGSLHITYTESEKDTHDILAEKTISLLQ